MEREIDRRIFFLPTKIITSLEPNNHRNGFFEILFSKMWWTTLISREKCNNKIFYAFESKNVLVPNMVRDSWDSHCSHWSPDCCYSIFHRSFSIFIYFNFEISIHHFVRDQHFYECLSHALGRSSIYPSVSTMPCHDWTILFRVRFCNTNAVHWK